MEKKVKALNKMLFNALSEESSLEDSFQCYQKSIDLSKDIEQILDQYDPEIQCLLDCIDDGRN